MIYRERLTPKMKVGDAVEWICGRRIGETGVVEWIGSSGKTVWVLLDERPDVLVPDDPLRLILTADLNVPVTFGD